MRLSCVPGDGGHVAYLDCCNAGRTPVVYVDGERIDNVIMVDTDRRIALVYDTDADGEYILDDERQVRRKRVVTGDVVRVRMRARDHAGSLVECDDRDAKPARRISGLLTNCAQHGNGGD